MRWIIACLMAMFLCAPYASAADPAQELWSKIEYQLAHGKELAACRLAKGMMQYKDSPVFPQAKKTLLARGISINDPLGSYTAKRLIALQNATERTRQKTGAAPDPGLRPKFKDAWGNPMRIEFTSHKKALYLVRSAGPDGVFHTSDDLVLATRASAEQVPQDTQDVSQQLREAGKKGMLKSRGQTSGSQAPSSKPDPFKDPSAKEKDGEVSVGLDQLLNQ